MKKKAIDENLIIGNGKCIGAHSWTFPTNQSYIAKGTPCDCGLKRYEAPEYCDKCGQEIRNKYI